MWPHSRNKLISVSFALAAAGVLTCVAALLDVFVPSGSLVGFLARMALLGLAVIVTVIGYAWACDQCESYVDERIEQLAHHGRSKRSEAASPWAAVHRQSRESEGPRDGRPSVGPPQSPVSRSRYSPTLHDSRSLQGAAQAIAARAWHGQ